MPKRTQIVCLHEGQQGRSVGPIFIRNLLKALNPKWVRPWTSSLIATVNSAVSQQPC